MAESEEEESWEEFFETNRLVPIHPSRSISQQPHPDICFCLNLKSIEGVLLPKILVSVLKIMLKMFIFNFIAPNLFMFFSQASVLL